MRRRLSIWLALIIAFSSATSIAFTPPLLVCHLTGRATPLVLTDSVQAPDDCCDEIPAAPEEPVTGHSLRTASCCHIVPAVERVPATVTLAVPLVGLPPVAELVPAVPPCTFPVICVPLVTDQTAPRGPPPRRTPPRAPPIVS